MLRISTAGGTFAAFLVFAAALYGAFTFTDSEMQAPFGPDQVPLSDAPDPRHLLIPALNIDAPVQRVGINKKGNMAAPANFTSVGWYKHGPKPGGAGTAVMAGYLDNALGLAGVFRNLNNMRSGDDIYVLGADGKKIHFKVTDIKTFGYNDDLAKEAVFTSPNNRARLALITCGGSWIQKFKTYSERLIVIAELKN